MPRFLADSTPANRDQSAVDCSGDRRGLPNTFEVILDDDEDPDGDSVFEVNRLVPSSPRSSGRLNASRRINASGHLARCAILRC